MSEPFIAEVKIFAGNFAPRGWAFCDGQIFPITQNTALFSLLGTTYGGDGRTTFALPNLRSRAAMHPGNGPGLAQRRLGENGGVNTVTLADTQMPSHEHALMSLPVPGNASGPAGNTFARTVGAAPYGPPNNLVTLAAEALLPTGGSNAHNNRQPYLVLNFIISLAGEFPSRN